MKDNEFIVRVKSYNDDREVMVTSFTTNNLFEYIKIIDYLYTNEIPIKLPDDKYVVKEYRGYSFMILDFDVSIASDISTTCLDIWIES